MTGRIGSRLVSNWRWYVVINKKLVQNIIASLSGWLFSMRSKTLGRNTLGYAL